MAMYSPNRVVLDGNGQVFILRNNETKPMKCPYNHDDCTDKCPLLSEIYDEEDYHYVKFCNGSTIQFAQDNR